MGRYDGYFASGSNAPGEIAGLRAIGMNAGVAASRVYTDSEVAANARKELKAYAGNGCKVFIDSGAFSEVDKNLNVKPGYEMDAKLGKAIALYDEMAKALGSQLYVVAPDRVGCQVTTLERLTKYAWRMKALRKRGANIIVPIQKGELAMADFDAAVTETLGFSDYVRGIPLCKDATSIDELRTFAAALPAGTKLHLLGKGPRSVDYMNHQGRNAGTMTPGYDTCMATLGHLVVTCDSVRITALAKRGNSPGKLTKVQDRLRQEYGYAYNPDGTQPNLPPGESHIIKRDAIIEVLGAEMEEAAAAALAA